MFYGFIARGIMLYGFIARDNMYCVKLNEQFPDLTEFLWAVFI